MMQDWRRRVARGVIVAAIARLQHFTPAFSDDVFMERLVNPELVFFCTFAVMTGVYTDRERRQKKNYQEVASKLWPAHEVGNPPASISGEASIETESQRLLPVVECDPEQLRQALLNLLSNAIEANPNGGRVTQADEGSGVAPEDVEKLFDPFSTTKESGTGLGFSVAYQIMNKTGGQLTARRNPDRGTTFSVVLPVRQRIAA